MSTATDTKAGVKLTLTLANGETYSLQVRKTPKHWKSALLRQLPYGTDIQGATYSISK